MCEERNVIIRRRKLAEEIKTRLDKLENKSAIVKTYKNKFIKAIKVKKQLTTEEKEKMSIKAKKRRKSKKGKYNSYKISARNRGIVFDLSIEEFSAYWMLPCYYCRDNIETIGIDRIDSKEGYYKGNIVSCCSTCNSMKMAMPISNFLKQCKKIANYNKN